MKSNCRYVTWHLLNGQKLNLECCRILQAASRLAVGEHIAEYANG